MYGNNKLKGQEGRNLKYPIVRVLSMKWYTITRRQIDKLYMFTINPKATIKIIENK